MEIGQVQIEREGECEITQYHHTFQHTEFTRNLTRTRCNCKEVDMVVE